MWNMISKSVKSLTELRGLAQSMGCKWSFSDDSSALKQKISLKQTDLLPPIPVPIIPIPEDQRLRTKPPSKISDEQTIRTMLQPYIERGMRLTISEGQFEMRHGERVDTGTMRQPPRVLIDCARRIMA